MDQQNKQSDDQTINKLDNQYNDRKQTDYIINTGLLLRTTTNSGLQQRKQRKTKY